MRGRIWGDPEKFSLAGGWAGFGLLDIIPHRVSGEIPNKFTQIPPPEIKFAERLGGGYGRLYFITPIR